MQTPLQKAFYKIESLRQEVARLQERFAGDIAIIGVAVDFPEAGDADTFWQNLLSGKNSIRPIAPERQQQVSAGRPAAPVFDTKGYLQRISGFDPGFFGITEKDAVLMNPAQRLFLKNAWQVLEDGGYSGAAVNGKNVGVYVGYSGDLAFKEYTELIAQTNTAIAAPAVVGNASAILPGRISHLLNLRGPSMVIDTACSSSLVAVYEAVRALQSGHCEMAVASGVQIEIFPQQAKYQVGFESADGNIRPFDKKANGTVAGEGVGSVLLKPLKTAIEDRDHIYAVIRGGAVNHDGLSSSITAPNLAAQTELLKSAWADAQIQPEELIYIETHGTGTQLGDPIELGAIEAAFQAGGPATRRCYAGSVKANIGHLFACAGMASLIKCLLVVSRRSIPRQINLESPVDALLQPSCPLEVNLENIPLPAGQTLICGVSSFGFSGTNCHLVISAFEMPPGAVSDAGKAGGPALFTLSGKSQAGLLRQAETLLAFLRAGHTPDYRDLCFTRNQGRAHQRYRCAFVVESLPDIDAGLQACLQTMQHSNLSGQDTPPTVADSVGTNQAARQVLATAGSDANREALQQLAGYYLQGADIDWAKLYAAQQRRRVSCPTYVFEEKDYWAGTAAVNTETPGNRQDIQSDLLRLAVDITGLEASVFQPEAEFFELGVDSLVLLQMIEAIKAAYKVSLQIGQFYDDIVTVGDLVAYLEKNAAPLPAAAVAPPAPAPPALSTGAPAGLDDILRRLDRIESKIGEGAHSSRALALPDTGAIYYGNPVMEEPRPLSAAQRHFLSTFIRDYQQKTRGSKNYSGQHRAYFSDWINSIDYRHSLKELLYPIVAQKAEGARAWDIDGNEYIDIGLGYGVSFFGNNPAFIKNALAAQLDAGFELAFQTKLAGDIAAQISALTGVERVAFSNTGTEAVMAAVRLARAKTRKPKIVIFTGSYHGTFDGVLGMKGETDGQTFPISAGTPFGFVDDLLVLNFGTQEALDTLAQQAGSIAAVLMEPVQSRKPDVQLGDYIRQLRKLTEQLNIALIFDEIITGFRIGPGGAQAHFGISADIVTYGKVIGGGMPLGIVAGKRAFLDLIDGGAWNFGDDSYPGAKKMLFGGTFCKHPLALAAAAAVLGKIKAEGEVFYPKVNRLSDYLADTLNAFFQAEEMPLTLVHFGALFRFEFKGKYQALNNPIEIPVFFYLLNYHGVYTWERRICFLSTEHTREDIDGIIAAVQKTVRVMKANGWFEESAARGTATARPNLKPLFHAQLRLWMLDQFNAGQIAYNLGYAYAIEGDFRADWLEKAFQVLLERHEVLRANVVLHDNNPMLLVRDRAGFGGKMDFLDLTDLPADAVQASLREAIWKQFDIEKDPLIRLRVIRQGTKHFVAISVHHLIADGWSVNVLFSEIGQLYRLLAQQSDPVLPAPRHTYNDLLAEEVAYLDSLQLAVDQAYWAQQLSGELPKLDFPTYKKRPPLQSNKGKMNRYTFPREHAAFLQDLAKQEKVSLYTALLGLVKIVLYKLTRQQDIIVGTSVHGRKSGAYFQTVGNFINNIALRSRIEPGQSVHDFLQELKRTLFDGFEHQNYPFDLLVELLNAERDLSRSPVFDIMVQIESGDLTAYYQADDLFPGLHMSQVEVEDNSCERDLFIEFVHQGENLSAKINYNTDVFEDFQIRHFFDSLLHLAGMLRHSGCAQRIGDMEIILPAEKRFLDAVNKTGKFFPAESNFVQLFERQAREQGTAPALALEGREYSYATLNGAANRLASYLHQVEDAGPLVGVLMHRGLQMMTTILAIWKSGKAYVPIDPDYPVRRILDIAQEAKFGLLITGDLPAGTAKVLAAETGAPFRLLDFSAAEAACSHFPADNPGIEIAPRDLAYVIFTSGSTGQPKGAMVEHLGMLNHMCAKINDLNLGPVLLPANCSLPKNMFPLNACQQEQWLAGQNPAFRQIGMAQLGFTLDEASIDQAVFEQAFATLFVQYPFLASTFERVNGTLVRTVPAESALPLAILPDPDRISVADYPLPGAFFRATLVRDPDDRWTVHYQLHELIAAPGFITTLHHTLCANYQALLRQGKLRPKKIGLDYAHTAEPLRPEVARWFAENLQSYQRMAFNIGRFHRDNGETKALAIERLFDPGLVAGLEQLAAGLGIELSELLFGISCLLVHKYTGSTLVTLDVAFEPGGTGTIPQTNCLPATVQIVKTDSVEAALVSCARVHRALAAGQSFPYAAIGDFLAQTTGATLPAIEKCVLFRFEPAAQAGGIRPDRHDSAYDLAFEFRLENGALILRLSANERLLDSGFATQITRHVETVLASLGVARQLPVAALPYISAAEQAQVLYEFNTPATGIEGLDVIQAFEQHALRQGNHPVLVFQERVCTWESINKKANQLARLLVSRFGVAAGSKVGILLERSEHLLVSLLAVLKTGAAYVPFDLNFPAERIAFIGADAGIDVLIVDDKGSADLAGEGFSAVLQLDETDLDLYSGENLGAARQPNELFSILYTSGTTGAPKGVAIRNESISALLAWGMEEFRHDPFDHVLACTPVCFDVSMFELFFPLVKGKTLLFFPDKFGMDDIQCLLDDYPNIAIHTSPTFISTLLEEGVDLSHVSVLNLAGEPVPLSFRRIFNGKNIEVRNLYGPCETTVYSSCYRFDDTHQDIIPIGKPLRQEQLYIVDDDLELVPAGVTGEICIAGAGVSEGYLNRPELNAEKFISAPFAPGVRMYRTGDFGRFLPDGNLEFLGRKDNQVKVRGYRIELGEIENALNGIDQIIASVVDLSTDQHGEKHLLAYYIATDGKPEDAVREHLIRQLPHYMVPSYIIRLEALPKTINGKIDKSRLPKPSRLTQTAVATPDRIRQRRHRVDSLLAPPKAVIAQNASHCFDISVWQMFTAHLTGGKTVVYRNDRIRDVLELINAVDQDAITVLELVPSYLGLVLDLFEERQLDPGLWRRLSCVISTGETLKGNLVNRWFKIFPSIPLVNAYGPTEASDDITHHILNGPVDAQRLVPVGRPVQNMKIFILDEHRNRCPVGVKGTICVAGTGVGKGYIHQPEKTAGVFFPSPFDARERMYDTGDIGRYLPDGSIEFFGRTDAQIKIRGNRIELGEIDAALTSIHPVKEAVTLLKEFPEKDPQLVSYVTCRQKIAPGDIRTELASRIPIVPDEIIVLDALPLNANGKVDRKALLQRPAPHPAKTSPRPTPAHQGDTNGVLRQFWTEVLGHDDFTDTDSFFEQGGNSLKLMKLFRRIDDRYPEKIKIPDLFRKVTIAEQARLLQAGDTPAGAPARETIVELEF